MRKYVIVFFIWTMCVACTDIGSFSTGEGECYRGKIVDADYVRSGFEPGITLSLTLDTSVLATGSGSAGLLWTSDGIFEAATIRQMKQIAHDPFSLFQFPGGRIKNYLVHVPVSNGTLAIAVISLMENQEVEIRIMQPNSFIQLPKDEKKESKDLFGVFRLKHEPECTVPNEPISNNEILHSY